MEVLTACVREFGGAGSRIRATRFRPLDAQARPRVTGGLRGGVKYHRRQALTASVDVIGSRLAREIEADGGTVYPGFPWWLRFVLSRRTLAITIGHRIYLGRELLARGADEIEAIVVHELEHVRQFARVGLMRFAWQYARDYARNRRRGLSSFEAYEAISFEVEARVAENRLRRAKENGEDVRTA